MPANEQTAMLYFFSAGPGSAYGLNMHELSEQNQAQCSASCHTLKCMTADILILYIIVIHAGSQTIHAGTRQN